jgi:hypothetical protein
MDMDDGYHGAFLPKQLGKKYKTSARDLIRQWFFPAKRLTVVPNRQRGQKPPRFLIVVSLPRL